MKYLGLLIERRLEKWSGLLLRILMLAAPILLACYLLYQDTLWLNKRLSQTAEERENQEQLRHLKDIPSFFEKQDVPAPPHMLPGMRFRGL